MKRRTLLAMVLSLIMCLGMSWPAWAAEEEETYVGNYTEQQIEELAKIVKSVLGYNNLGLQGRVELADMQIGQPINVYNYTTDGFVKADMMSPVMYNNELIALGTWAEEHKKFGMVRTLAKQIQAAVDNDTAFALVFDYKCCYLFDGTNWKLLRQYSPLMDENNAVLDPYAVIDTSVIELDASLAETFNLTGNYSFRAADNGTRELWYRCPVQLVRQTTDDTCWAACAAMVVNYIKGTSYTDTNVAKEYAKIDEKYAANGVFYFSNIPDVLELFGVNNYVNSRRYTGDIIATSIARDYPVIGNFQIAQATYHSCVICGINGGLDTIAFLDPLEDDEFHAYYDEASEKYYIPWGSYSRTLTQCSCPLW